MATITTIDASDLITDSRADINTNFANLNSDKIETSVLDTDTTLAANSDAKIPTQKAVKAYVDAGGNVTASETTKGIVEEATDAEVTAGSATGATGAKLFVTPAKLLASAYATAKSITAGGTINGATLPVPVYQNKTDNEFYACDGNDTTKLKFLGFAISNGTDGNAMTVQFSGVVGGFSGLDEGEKYYLSDTVGTISNAPGTYPVLVGVAISQTQLLIQKGVHRRVGVATFTDNGGVGATSTSVIDLGFRPSAVRGVAYLLTTGDIASSSGAWTNGLYACIYADYNESSASANVTTATDAMLKLTDSWAITITSVTDTGFTITATQGVTSPLSMSLYWEAEGDF